MIWTDRPVIDLTGVSGSYEVDLNWCEQIRRAAEDTGDGVPAPALSTHRESGGVAPLHALAAYGLKSEVRKIPLKFLVIDSADKIPLAN